jgi:predicted DNA-binding transcriptional regulator YafY
MRDIPPEKHDFNSRLSDDKKLIALFDKSVKHLLIDTYGFNCYQETDDGLLFEVGYTNQSYIVGWLLSFGDKVKVIEPSDLSFEIQAIAKNILSRYF